MIEKMVKSRSKVADLEISGIGQKAGLWRIENRSKGEKGISGDMGKRSRSGDLRNQAKTVIKQGSLARIQESRQKRAEVPKTGKK